MNTLPSDVQLKTKNMKSLDSLLFSALLFSITVHSKVIVLQASAINTVKKN